MGNQKLDARNRKKAQLSLDFTPRNSIVVIEPSPDLSDALLFVRCAYEQRVMGLRFSPTQIENIQRKGDAAIRRLTADEKRIVGRYMHDIAREVPG